MASFSLMSTCCCRSRYHDLQLVRLDRLAQDVKRSVAHQVDGLLDARVLGEHDDDRVPVHVAQHGREVLAAPARQHLVGDHACGRLFAIARHRLVDVADAPHRVPGFREDACQPLALAGLLHRQQEGVFRSPRHDPGLIDGSRRRWMSASKTMDVFVSLRDSRIPRRGPGLRRNVPLAPHHGRR
jgi:hypothetical protein